MDGTNSALLESPLVLWIKTFAGVDELLDLVDGHLLNKIMTDIDPSFFGMSFVHSNVDGDVGLRVQNLERLLRGLKNFYQEKLQQIIIMDLPNIYTIASEPESEQCIRELHKILLLILGCAVQCDRKEFFIDKITSLNESIQQELVMHIKEITEQTDNVFAFHPNEIETVSHEDLLTFCEQMYDQMIKLVSQRDISVEETHRLLVDRGQSTKEVNGNVRNVKSPTLSPTSSEIRLAEKVKFRQITEELDEKDLLIQELKEDIESNKALTEKLLKENESSTESARWMNTYRDEFEVLKVKVEKTKKLESDVTKYKEKLQEMEAVRKRTQELEEQNEILYDTKMVLEKQVETLSSKADKLGETEREIARLKKKTKDLTEEKLALETRHQNVLDENARLLLDAQNSLSEVSNLSCEIDMMKDKDESGVTFANECNLVSSTKLLRLEHENHQLKVLIGELSQHKNNAIPQPIVKETIVENGTYKTCFLAGDEVSEKAQVEVVESLASIKKVLDSKESELSVIQETLKKKEEFVNKISESLSKKEQENKELQDRIQQITNQKKRTDQLIQMKNDDYAELERRLEEGIVDRQKSDENLRKKIKETNELNERLEDVKLKNTNIENQLTRIQYKYEAKVKRSLEDVDNHKVRRQESVRRREEQIKSLEQSNLKLETMLQAQERHIKTLQERLEGSVSERNKLGSSISKKESAIHQLQTKILELEESMTETKKLNELVRIKDDTIQRLEDRLEEVGLVLSRSKSSNREKNEKIETLQTKVEEVTESNNRLDQKLKKKEETVLNNERELMKLENRFREVETSLEKKEKEMTVLKQREVVPKTIEVSLMSSPRNAKPEEDNNKTQELKQKLWEADAKIEEAETLKGKLEHQVKRKQTQIHELEKKLEDITDAIEENERLKKSVCNKDERIKILQNSLDQNQEEINSLESRLESSTSEIYKLRKSDDEKKKRINSFKMQLENSNGVNKILNIKEQEIKTLQDKNNELQSENAFMNKHIHSLETELEDVRNKKVPLETIVVDYSPKQIQSDLDNGQLIDDDFNEAMVKLKKKNEDLVIEMEIVAGRCVKFSKEKDMLSQDLEIARSDYDQLISDLNELKDSYSELDLSSAKSLHRCEMLTQMNSTLEEENRMLMEQMSKLLNQNQELLTESLVSRDQFMEEERSFSDRLYELQRQKEKLEEKIDQANRSLLENTPKKKSNLFKKVLQKAGLKKKKDEATKGRSPVQLMKYGIEGSSDVSADSGSSIPGVYPLSAERISDSSNVSEETYTANSPERDISPLARRRLGMNRAHRARVVHSAYDPQYSPNTSLSGQGMSRSLDAREFFRELIQNSTPEEQASVVVGDRSSSDRKEPSFDAVDSPRRLNRTRSFNLGERNSGSSDGGKRMSSGTKSSTDLVMSAGSVPSAPQPNTPRKESDGSRKSSAGAASLASRSSSQYSGDTSGEMAKATVRHVGSTPARSPMIARSTMTSNDGMSRPKHFKSEIKNENLEESSARDELRLSSGIIGGSTGNEKIKSPTRHQSPSPPGIVAAGEKPRSTSTVEINERQMVQSKRSSSFADTAQASTTNRHQVYRQNSDRPTVGSLDFERKVVVHSKPSPTHSTASVTSSISRQSSLSSSGSRSGRSHAEQATGTSIGIVSFKEVPRIQSAVRESSPKPERKQRPDIEPKAPPSAGGDTNPQQSPSLPRGPQTPKSLRRTAKLEDLSAERQTPSAKSEREKQALWFEYGQV